MWPQKWYASAFCAFRLAAKRPPPVRPSSSRPVRARKPRREVEPATASLSRRSGTDAPGCVGDEALELEERVERSLGEHLAVAAEHDCVRAPGHGQRRPRLGLHVLVEEHELDLG